MSDIVQAYVVRGVEDFIATSHKVEAARKAVVKAQAELAQAQRSHQDAATKLHGHMKEHQELYVESSQYGATFHIVKKAPFVQEDPIDVKVLKIVKA